MGRGGHRSRGGFGWISPEELERADDFFEELMGLGGSLEASTLPLGPTLRPGPPPPAPAGSGQPWPGRGPGIPYHPTSTADAKARLARWLMGQHPDGVEPVPPPAHGLFPHASVCLLHIVSAAGPVHHATGFLIAPDRILTSANVLLDGGVSIVPEVRAEFGLPGSPTRVLRTIRSPDIHLPRPTRPGAVPLALPFNLGVLKLTNGLSGARPFDLPQPVPGAPAPAVPPLPVRMVVIAYHTGNPPALHQWVHVGHVLGTTPHSSYLIKVFRAPPSPTGPPPQQGSPVIHIDPPGPGPRNRAAHQGWTVFGVINDRAGALRVPASPFARRAAVTWLTPARAQWARTV